jgi:hypothetical protein
MTGQITRYSLGWHTKENSGEVVIEVDGRRRIRLSYESAAEFGAVAAVLRESPVYYRSDGLIRTGAEIAEE